MLSANRYQVGECGIRSRRDMRADKGRPCSQKEIGAKMQDFFVTYVFPEFKSEIGFLRVRALDMVEKYEENDMTWPDSERLEEMFSMVMTCVTDSALPVRVQAALALPELVRYEEGKRLLSFTSKSMIFC